MTLKNLIRLFSDKGCSKFYVKELQRNNNSKQQIYISTGDTKILNLFPIVSFRENKTGDRKYSSFHAAVDFSWLDTDGVECLAPQAKFIFYPDYPEVRFSGFLAGCKNPPSKILNNKVPGRLLFFGITMSGKVFGFVVNPEDELANEFSKLKNLEKIGVLFSVGINNKTLITDTRSILLKELKRIHLKGWIESKQMGADYIISPCNTSRCGGPTLEAELGIIQNGRSEPDYMGWEIKQFGVKNFSKLNGAKITLMTPEPDGGFYKSNGIPAFLRKYGYMKKNDRYDFNGVHKAEIIGKKTGLEIKIRGFDFENNIINDITEGVYLIDKEENVAASWSFGRLLEKFKKYEKASYVPSKLMEEPVRKYSYSNKVLIGTGTNFSYFMNALNNKNIVYDPAVRIKDLHTKPDQKSRNQFRTTSTVLSSLYDKLEVIDLLEI